VTTQSRFPYILVTTETSVVQKAEKIAVSGVQDGLHIHTFLADMVFEEVFQKLSEASTNFGLVLVEDANYKGSGEFAKVFGHIM